MILIADAGSTKTQWRFLGKETKNIFSEGINPYFQEKALISASIENILDQSGCRKDISNVFYYGAGCANPANNALLKNIFTGLLAGAAIEVQTDLLGAARGVCGKKEGLAAILGTGSNSCHYDGQNIIKNHPSLGYILGDEGSGAYIGKKFIQEVLNGEAPVEIIEKFFSSSHLSKDDILEGVYKKPNPNRFLASFVKFLALHLQHSYVLNLMEEVFDLFIDRHIAKYEGYQSLPLNCVGSVAFYFKEVLEKTARRKGLSIGKIVADPMDGMEVYHRA